MKCRTGVLLAAVLFAMAATQAPSARAAIVAGYEHVVFSITPSAERAYKYGARHFDATHAANYDLDRAEYFFTKAEAIDPQYPTLQHQLARVAFLKGDFSLALIRINNELADNPNPSPSSYYVKGLIEGFMGKYSDAAKDYETYLRTDPTNWAAINDYAWVLLKADRPEEALVAIEKVLPMWPENPWLHNSRATALFDMGRLEEARDAAAAASRAVAGLTEAEWLQAYPGNDPLIAKQGIEAFQRAIAENMHSIELALEKVQKDMR